MSFADWPPHWISMKLDYAPSVAVSIHCHAWQRFLSVTLPVIRNIMLITTLFSIIWTFADFQLIYVLTKGGPSNSTLVPSYFAYRNSEGGLYGRDLVVSKQVDDDTFVIRQSAPGGPRTVAEATASRPCRPRARCGPPLPSATGRRRRTWRTRSRTAAPTLRNRSWRCLR